MQFKSSEFSLQDFLLLQPKQPGEFIIDPSFSFDNTSLHTNDTLSHSEETWSLSSLAVKKLRKQKKGVVDPKNVTLKEMVVKRQRTQVTKKGEKSLDKSKKIRKDSEERNVTSASFAKRQHTQKWNPEETKKFYKGLEFFGTDFSMIAKLFGTRNRLQIKNKFRKEERMNLQFIDECLKKHSSNRFSMLVGKIRKTSCTSVDSLDRKIIGEIENFTTELNDVDF